jgi:sialic acid synthase SpsE/mannose-6-phosphate isomerase-like protein (cupin superfamily)
MFNKKPLFIFEMANNHQGSILHGCHIITEVRKVCESFTDIFDFAFKFQYRNLDTFIHSDYKSRLDIKNIKRFTETRLSWEQFEELKEFAQKAGFYTICTGFDENSVLKIEEHDYDAIKIASCSFNDWPLLEVIAEAHLPVIASTAGVELDDIDQVASFFKNRNLDLTLMHCVAEYPTSVCHLQLNQIDLLKNRYKGVTVGYSTHEEPGNFAAIQIAIAKGAQIFEKHVGVPTDKIMLNDYSANPEQVYNWLISAEEAFSMCGIKGKRHQFAQKEQQDLLALKRGVFAKRNLSKGEILSNENVYYAFPSQTGQINSSQMSKYNKMVIQKEYLKNEPIFMEEVQNKNIRPMILEYVKELLKVLEVGHVVIPVNSKCELSHHYGIKNFHQTGATIIDCINREYCKKILVLLPGQNHPSHFHKQKEETFNILYGTLELTLNGLVKEYHKGDFVVVERAMKHSFASAEGCVFEEISTTHFINDSFYEDQRIIENNERKTQVFLTQDMLKKWGERNDKII